jgi:hypothetical protein
VVGHCGRAIDREHSALLVVVCGAWSIFSGYPEIVEKPKIFVPKINHMQW